MHLMGYLPPGTEVGIRVGERRAVLPKIGIEWRGKALEAYAKVPMQALKHRHRQGSLGELGFLGGIQGVAKPKKKPVDEVLDDIDKKVETRTNDLNKEISAVRDLITSQQREHSQQLNREFSNFRSDLDAIKGLLLNRKQFPGPVAPLAVPSIPAWQLAGSPHHHHRHSGSDDNEKGDDAGSGSGSSETEVVTKNSDSSLEIM